MSAPKRYPAPLGDTPQPLMSETDEWDGEETKGFGVGIRSGSKGAMGRKESHHQDPTKGGRTLGRRVGLLVSGRLRGSVRRMVSTGVSTGCLHSRCRGALGQWLAGSGSVRHERRIPVHPRSPPKPDNRTPRNTTSKRLNSSTFFDTRRKNRIPG